MGREEGAAGHILELTVAGTPEDSGGIRAKILDRAGGRYGTLEFRKSRTITCDPLANTDEILEKNLRKLDRRVGRVVYCSPKIKNQALAK